jgi:uncharacterized UBP type Zn finger protein
MSGLNPKYFGHIVGKNFAEISKETNNPDIQFELYLLNHVDKESSKNNPTYNDFETNEFWYNLAKSLYIEVERKKEIIDILDSRNQYIINELESIHSKIQNMELGWLRKDHEENPDRFRRITDD